MSGTGLILVLRVGDNIVPNPKEVQSPMLEPNAGAVRESFPEEAAHRPLKIPTQTIHSV